MRKITFNLRKEIESLNVTMAGRGWKSRHFRNAKHKEEWEELFREVMKPYLNLYLKSKPLSAWPKWVNLKKRIIITRIMGPRRRAFDHDNLVGGCKSLVDAMKSSGVLIRDDTEEYVEIEYEQEKGCGGTRITVEVVDEG